MTVIDVRDMTPEPWRLGVETRMLVSASNGAGDDLAMGDAFSLADCAAAPALSYANEVMPFDTHANLTACFDRRKARPSYAPVLKEGLHPTSKGARIKYSGKTPEVSHGPFAVTNDLVAGFWLIQVKSLDDAIDWMKRAPFDGGAEIEIRQVFDAEDFGEALTPELREQETRLRAQAGRK